MKEDYEIHILTETQRLVAMRKKLRINQIEMAHVCKVSLRTIQNFEDYKYNNGYLVWAYERYLSNNYI